MSRIAGMLAIAAVIMGALGRPGEAVMNQKQETAIFAGGCFWCMQPPFEKLKGVTKVEAGYTGGKGANPTYENYAEKGHIEAIRVTYDPAVISYDQLLDVFWHQIDPTDEGGEFVDRGPQYRSAIFFHNEDQRMKAEKSKTALAESRRFSAPIMTEILSETPFYPAEDYHQDYYKKSPIKYKYYRYNSGRDQFLDRVWGPEHTGAITPAGPVSPQAEYHKPPLAELKSKLTPLQFEVTQKKGTEPPFKNEYWDNKKDGIYVDIVSGEPLFSSLDKFDSGTGWPSYTKPLEPGNIVERPDNTLFAHRTEVRSKHGDSHLGHVFNDGPQPTGLRYCMNSAALRFIPKEDLEKEGLGRYLPLFKSK